MQVTIRWKVKKRTQRQNIQTVATVNIRNRATTKHLRMATVAATVPVRAVAKNWDTVMG